MYLCEINSWNDLEVFDDLDYRPEGRTSDQGNKTYQTRAKAQATGGSSPTPPPLKTGTVPAKGNEPAKRSAAWQQTIDDFYGGDVTKTTTSAKSSTGTLPQPALSSSIAKRSKLSGTTKKPTEGVQTRRQLQLVGGPLPSPEPATKPAPKRKAEPQPGLDSPAAKRRAVGTASRPGDLIANLESIPPTHPQYARLACLVKAYNHVAWRSWVAELCLDGAANIPSRSPSVALYRPHRCHQRMGY